MQRKRSISEALVGCCCGVLRFIFLSLLKNKNGIKYSRFQPGKHSETRLPTLESGSVAHWSGPALCQGCLARLTVLYIGTILENNVA